MNFEIECCNIREEFNGEEFAVHLRGGVTKDGAAKLVYSKMLDRDYYDLFSSFYTITENPDGSFSEGEMCEGFKEINNEDGSVTVAADIVPMLHKATGVLLATGGTCCYLNGRHKNDVCRSISYITYNDKLQTWNRWKTLDLPSEIFTLSNMAGSVQRFDEENGDILLPIVSLVNSVGFVTVIRLGFDGETLRFKEAGNTLCEDYMERGMHEPSITKFNGRYYLTIRSDTTSWVSVSDDGLHFEKPRRWTFDDGSDLGTYNTQQHWVTHQDALYLVYTRRGADNDHVFRHRAPLFMAEVNPEKLFVVRETETIIVPNRGARLGNFGVLHKNEFETWVTVNEWMQPRGCEKYGSNGAFFVSKIKWKKPNMMKNLTYQYDE